MTGDNGLALNIPINAVTEGFNNAMKGVQDSVGGIMSGVKEKLGVVQEAFGAVGLMAGNYLKGAVEMAAKGQQNFVDLQQTIKSTGGAAGYTADQIKAMSGQLSQQTTFSAGEIMKGQNMLLTFTNISGQVFKDASMSMLDLSQKMGTAPQQTAIQLGKALNDPIKGVTALTRVGVTFTDQQKEQIKTMEESGNMAGAQRVILNELNKEFGGQASAQLNTYAGQIKLLNNNMNSMKAAIGSAILPYLQAMMTEINKAIMPIIAFIKAHSQMAAAILVATTAIGTLVGGFALFQKVSSILGPAVTGITSLIGSLSLPIAGVVAAIGLLVLAYTKNFGGLKDFVDGTFKRINEAVQTGIGVFNKYHDIMAALTSGLEKIFGRSIAIDILQPIWMIKDGLTIFISFIKGDFRGVGDLLSLSFGVKDGKINNVVNSMREFRQNLLNIFNQIVNYIRNSIPNIRQIIQSGFQLIVQTWNSVLRPALILMLQIMQSVVSWVIAHWPQIFGVIQSVFTGIQVLWNSILRPVLTFIIQQMGQLIQWVSANWPLISNTISIVMRAIYEGIKIYMDMVRPFWTATWDIIKNVVPPIWNLIKDVVSTTIKIIADVIKLVMDIINGNWKAAWNDVCNLVRDIFGGAINIVKDILNLIKGAFIGFGSAALDLGKGMIQNIIDGINGMIGSIVDVVKGIAGKILDAMKSVLGIHSPSTETYAMGGHLIQGFINGLSNNQLVDFVKKWAGNIMSSMKTSMGGNVSDWLMQAIQATGQSMSVLPALLQIAQHESGGDPNSINLWDSNAKAGHPSQGLMQMIPETFQTYMMAGHNNILNPVDNAISAIRYMIGRYGSVLNVPGIKSLMAGGNYVGYATGTLNATQGFHMFGENGPELGWANGGEGVLNSENTKALFNIPVILQNLTGAMQALTNNQANNQHSVTNNNNKEQKFYIDKMVVQDKGSQDKTLAQIKFLAGAI